MARLQRLLMLAWCFQLAAFSEPGCEIELECEECLPEHMPTVEGAAAGGAGLRAAAGAALRLSCGAGAFLAYPARRDLSAVCEAGQWRLQHDGALLALLDLGCQESIFEDVLHSVEHCGGALQGRAYLTRGTAGGARHLATLCYDPDRALAVRAHAAAAPLTLPAHAEPGGPLSLLGNFNHMFDARTRHEGERLYGDDAALGRRLRALLRPEGVALAGQALTAARLLPAAYFAPQDARVADFPSNKIAAWRSVAEGNLRHAQLDVAAALRRVPGLRVWTGTHGVMSVRGGRELYLKPGRFPVPQYVWTLAVDGARRRALVVVVLNDPFVSVSEVRARVWCESACGAAGWLGALQAGRRYETPLYGLAFCCEAHEAAAVLAGLPAAALAGVPRGREGMLLDLPDQE